MKHDILPAIALAFATATAAVQATPVYLKAGATGAADGTSWADAYTNAVTAINAAAAGDGVLYAAQGVYVFSTRLTVASDLAIYGGFAGESMDETPATRDTAAHPTVFSGDVKGDDVWRHYAPSGYTATFTKLSENPVVGPAGIIPPPPFTGDYDGYGPDNCTDNIRGAILFTDQSTAILDGLTFTGFYPTDAAGATTFGTVITLQKAGSAVNDCTFIGNNTSYGALFFRANATVTNCRFLYNWGNYRGCGMSTHNNATATVDGCTFLCCSRTGKQAGNVFNGWAGAFVVRNCTIARCLSAAGETDWGTTAYNGAANLYASEGGKFSSFTDCVVSNCHTACHKSDGPYMPLLNANVAVTRTLFANNSTVVKPIAGKCYAMIGANASSNNHGSFDSCTFTGNVVSAPQTYAMSGSYVLSVIGNYSSRCDASLLNCTFDGNRAEACDAPNVTPILCRGVATAAYAAGAANQAGLANCAFRGPADGTYDIVQYGNGHSKALNIVNCLFVAEGEQQLSPVHADVPELVRLLSCSVQNLFPSGSDTKVYDSLESDKVPLEAAFAPGSPRFALAAAARTPGIRTTCDVATNSATGTSISSWNFRPVGATDWEALSPSTVARSGSGFDAKLVGDALGNARPSGSFTRGPVQPLAGAAENGATLVLRREPFASGSFSQEAVQAVAAGGATTPVTLILADPDATSFAGWFDENGDLHSTSATLSFASLPAGTTVLTAKVTTPPVSLTFSLDGRGTFVGTGTDTITVTAPVASPFPEVPPFTMADGWHFLGFTLPDIVPPASATYTANTITTDVRVIRVVPADEACANPDGLTWATAYGDLAAAYADAGAYRGELWVKGGTYVVSDPIPVLPDVAVLGGFAGNETAASQADPEANPTVLTGDIQDNDYWRPNGNGGSLAANKIWQGGVFQPPNTNGADAVWTPTGNASEDALFAFSNSGASARRFLFDGLTFTCFQQSAVTTISREGCGPVFTRCKFLACMTGALTSESLGVVLIADSAGAFTNCVFDGNWRGVWLDSSSAKVTTFSGCVFSNNGSSSYGGAVYTRNQGYADIRDCRFFRNYCNARGYQGAAAVAFKGSGTTWNRISDCVFEENRAWVDCHGTVCVSAGNVEIARCEFLRNSIRNAKFVAETGNGAGIGIYGNGNIVVRDCHFAGNSAATASGNTIACASAFGQSGAKAVFANCTVEGSASTNAATATGHVATFALSGGSLAIVNGLVDGSSFSGDSTSEIFASDPNSTLSIVNDILRNDAGGYRPLAFTSASFEPTIASSAISGYDPADIPAPGANGFLYDVVSATVPVGQLREGPNGAVARGVAGPGYARFGRPVWLVGAAVYINDPAANAAKPWRNLLARTSHESSVTGLDVGASLLPDAFGARRKPSRIAIGPLNGAPMQTVIKVK